MELNWIVGVLAKVADGTASGTEIATAGAAIGFAFNVPTGSAEWIPSEYKTASAYPAAAAVYYLWTRFHAEVQSPETRGSLWSFFEDSWMMFDWLMESEGLACPSELADLLRCVVGNPFRPVAFDHAWRMEHTVGIAAKMYDERDFRAMPILADALEEAGCDSADVLSHCREPGPHARGCWVVDGVLGKR